MRVEHTTPPPLYPSTHNFSFNWKEKTKVEENYWLHHWTDEILLSIRFSKHLHDLEVKSLSLHVRVYCPVKIPKQWLSLQNNFSKKELVRSLNLESSFCHLFGEEWVLKKGSFSPLICTEIIAGAKIVNVSQQGSMIALIATDKEGKNIERVFDELLIAVGRVPNVKVSHSHTLNTLNTLNTHTHIKQIYTHIYLVLTFLYHLLLLPFFTFFYINRVWIWNERV
jgi:hypothetical protein